MNYRHAFHAGNFADVLKHAVLALVVEYLKLKEKPFCVLDTHAGTGRYRLDGAEALRTGEWRDGIGRLAGAGAEACPNEVAALLAPYLGVVRGLNPGGELVVYPGSPIIALTLMRAGDRLVANEMHPEDGRLLASEIGRDRRVRVLRLDGWQALKANLPPKERRGVVLVDPPFEVAGEFERLASGIENGLRRFATGTYILWFPLKDRDAAAALREKARAVAPDSALWAELCVGRSAEARGLATAGLLVINPPYRLEAQLRVLLPFLADRLKMGPGHGSELSVLAGPAPHPGDGGG